MKFYLETNKSELSYRNSLSKYCADEAHMTIVWIKTA